MKVIKSIRWLATWLSFWILKRSLGYRLKEDSFLWLQPVTSNDPKILNRSNFIIDHCTKRRVLHIGFTDHPFTVQKIKDHSLLHLQLQQVAGSLAGMDIESAAIDQYIALTKDEMVFSGDMMIEYPAAVIAFKPELVLLTEVLEHLKNPYRAIDILHKSFPEGTTVLVTVPNYTALDNLAASLNNTESIHPHHHWYFSPYTLVQLFDKERFKLNQLHFGMYFQPNSSINPVLKNYPFNGDCIMALFTILKKQEHE